MPTIHEPAVTASVFTPAISALRGWSTVIRVAKPIGVYRSTSDVPTMITTALTITATWLVFM